MDLALIAAIATIVGVLIVVGRALGWHPLTYEMADSHPLEDPVTERIFGPPSVFDHSPRQARTVIRHEMPSHRNKGWREVRILFGRECRFGKLCVWRGKTSDGSIEDCVLMARPPGAPPARPLPSGRAPVEVHSRSELPDGLDVSRVSWVRGNRLHGYQKILDNAGREWHLIGPTGTREVLTWKK